MCIDVESSDTRRTLHVLVSSLPKTSLKVCSVFEDRHRDALDAKRSAILY